MTTNTIAPHEKKLRNLRTVLWMIFSVVTVMILLCTSLSVPVFFLVKNRGLSDPSGITPGMLMSAQLVGMLLLIGAVGLVCRVAYSIFKSRIEKDEEFFI